MCSLFLCHILDLSELCACESWFFESESGLGVNSDLLYKGQILNNYVVVQEPFQSSK